AGVIRGHFEDEARATLHRLANESDEALVGAWGCVLHECEPLCLAMSGGYGWIGDLLGMRRGDLGFLLPLVLLLTLLRILQSHCGSAYPFGSVPGLAGRGQLFCPFACSAGTCTDTHSDSSNRQRVAGARRNRRRGLLDVLRVPHVTVAFRFR